MTGGVARAPYAARRMADICCAAGEGGRRGRLAPIVPPPAVLWPIIQRNNRGAGNRVAQMRIIGRSGELVVSLIAELGARWDGGGCGRAVLRSAASSGRKVAGWLAQVPGTREPKWREAVQ